MRGPGRADIVNAGSGESRYSECRVGESGYRMSRFSECGAGCGVRGGESGYSECRVLGRPDIVNAGPGQSGYSECRFRGEDIVNAGSG
ncbi:unnamed protein product, partial [Staurois parvus]